MKRYWLSIVLVPFIMLCIGTYYIQAAASGLPDFIMEKQEGEEKEAENVFLRGVYGHYQMNGMVTIRPQGSEYKSELPFYERIAPSYYWDSVEFEKFIKEHRQFMRGKREPFSFYEDENLLVYANAKWDFSSSRGGHNFRFNVSLLDKKRQDTSSYEVSVPDKNLYNSIFVHDVQVVGEELKIITQNYKKTGGRSEIHLYSLSLMSGQTPVDQIILSYLPESMGMETKDIRRGNQTDETQPSRYIVFHATQTKSIKNAEGSYFSQYVRGQVFVYNIHTGQEVKIESQEITDLFNSRVETDMINVYSNGDNLFLTKQSKLGIKVVQYSIPDARVTSNVVQTDFVISSTIKNHRLYMLVKKDRNSTELPTVAVLDVNTGKMLYKGMISLKVTEHDRAEALRKLRIHDIVVE